MKSVILPAFEVCGTLDGKITQIRRPVKIPYIIQGDETSHEHVLCGHIAGNPNLEDGFYAWLEDHPDEGVAPLKLLQVGQVLWVKETWRVSCAHNGLLISSIPHGDTVEYGADGDWYRVNGRIRGARSMPEWASRLKIEVTNTRLQQIKSASEEDAIAEGSRLPFPGMQACWCERQALSRIWNKTHGRKPGLTWDDNPWTVVYGVRRVHP